jgi:catechol 2,3-dioxygenase-like lactoylglutathione lyase family enzyme
MSDLIRQMGVVVVATPDPDRSADDLARIVGVRIRARSDQAILMSCNARQCEIAFVRAETFGIRSVGLEVADAAAVDEMLRRANGEGLTVLADTPSVPGVERAVRLRTPFGPILEIHTPVSADPTPRHHNAPMRVRRLDHANLRVDDTRGFYEFATTVLGLRLSDRTEDYARCWYRAADGYHHVIAAGAGAGLHHYGFDAFSIVDVAAVADALVADGRTLLWGMGHHGPGNNIFSYYRDPFGCVVEASYGMERVDNDLPPGVWDSDYDRRVLDLWGSKMPADYPTALTPFVE